MAAAASRPTKKSRRPRPTSFQDELSYKEVFFKFAPIYVATHTADKNFQVDDAVIAEFEKFLTTQGVDWTAADISGASDWIKARIKQDIVTIQSGQLQGLRVFYDSDPEVQKALTYMPEAQALEDNAHKVLAEKAQARNTAPEGVPTQP